ncbi:GerMN domain-containing protein [Clostridiisalibacter paucivorans]|uniref:GerMN domain-containing protein n=1 Tax=Clostridiisalibacter paucivorans TaxID=408753 RepID=UPI000478CEF6|nr:GerMN domain-containing protein [Clostridiisalibacter paucivorans]
MSTKKVISILMAVLILISLTGCGVIDTVKGMIVKDEEEPEVEMVRSDENIFEIQNDDSMRDTVLYYKTEAGYIVPVKRQIPWEEGIGKAALRNITDSPAIRDDIKDIGLNPIIPSGTEVIGMAIDQDTGLCKVNFSREVLNYNDEQDEYSLVKGIVYTLTEFPSISKVRLMVDGEYLDAMKFGTDIRNPLEREDINMVNEEMDGNSKVVVYYKGTTNGEYEYYVPLTIPTSTQDDTGYSALNKLFDGPPSDSSLYTDIPSEVSFRGLDIRDGVAYINLTEDSLSYIKDQYVVDSMTRNIALTLKEISPIDSVKIMINGVSLEETGIEVSEPTTVPVFANEY